MGDKQPEPEKGQKVLVALDGTNYSLRAFRGKKRRPVPFRAVSESLVRGA